MSSHLLELRAEKLNKTFKSRQVVKDVSFAVQKGEVVGLLGPNGAGKTSMLNCISGFYHPTRGDIFYKDKKLTHASPHQVSNMGISRAFQNLELFSGLTVLDNLLLARHQNLNYSFLHALFFYGKASLHPCRERYPGGD